MSSTLDLRESCLQVPSFSPTTYIMCARRPANMCQNVHFLKRIKTFDGWMGGIIKGSCQASTRSRPVVSPSASSDRMSSNERFQLCKSGGRPDICLAEPEFLTRPATSRSPACEMVANGLVQSMRGVSRHNGPVGEG